MKLMLVILQFLFSSFIFDRSINDPSRFTVLSYAQIFSILTIVPCLLIWLSNLIKVPWENPTLLEKFPCEKLNSSIFCKSKQDILS